MRNSDPLQPVETWRRLCLQLTVFCLPFVVGWAGLERWAARVPNVYALKRDRLAFHAQDVDTLVIGSSDAYFGIWPRLLSGSAFNLSGVGENLYETDCLATRVLPTLPKLKRAILSVNYATLFSHFWGDGDDWGPFYYEQEWGIPPENVNDWMDDRIWSRVALRTPRFYLSRLGESSLGLLVNGRFARGPLEIKQMDNRGGYFVGHTPPADLSPSASKDMLERYESGMRADYESESVAHLDHILSMLRQRNIEVDFITMPVWPGFKEGMKPDYWNEMQRVLAQRTNASSVRYYSFLSTPQMEPQDFLNAFHLNSHGAVRFTKLLNSVLNQGKQSSAAETNSILTNVK